LGKYFIILSEVTLKFEVKAGDINKFKCDAIIVNVFEGTEKPGGATAAVDSELNGIISAMLKKGEIKGKAGDVIIIHTLGRILADLVTVVGLGKKEEFDELKLRNLMGDAVRQLRKYNCLKVATILHGGGSGGLNAVTAAQAIVEGVLLGSYRFNKHITRDDEERDIEQLTILENDRSKLNDIELGLEKGRIMAEATVLARDMVNEPANYMTPSIMAEIARSVAEKHNLEITVLGYREIEELAMGGLLGVAKGSRQEPRFIIIKYKGDHTNTGTVGFIGKGLTFDSGGISLKPQEFMADMKGDMAGAADVIAAIGAIAELKLKLNVTAIVPATENLPGGNALKPGDVIKSYSGRTVEVVNTDAEGRLILADALSYAVKQGISPIIDLATLTGACHVALGDMYAGLFTNNQEFALKVLNAGKTAGEMLWQLPLPQEYKELNKSDIADIKNSGGRYGGAITAALFLREFVEDKPWVHLDIAGPFMAEKNKGILVKGATGFGVRTLIQLAMDLNN